MTAFNGMLCLVLLVGGAAAMTSKSTHGTFSGNGYTTDVRRLIEILEEDVNGITKDLSLIKTLAAATDDRINLIDDRELPSIRIRNEQQSDLIAKAEDLVSDLQDRVDAALAMQADTFTFVKATGKEIGLQTEFLPTSKKQEEDIFFLRKTLLDFEDSVLNDVYKNVNHLTSFNDDVFAMIAHLESFVDSRKVEYGSASVYPGQTFVPFLSVFPEAPRVSLFFTGGVATDTDETEVESYNSADYDSQLRPGFDLHPSNVTSEGFFVNAKDLILGPLSVDTLSYFYTASLNLDKDAVVDHGQKDQGNNAHDEDVDLGTLRQ